MDIVLVTLTFHQTAKIDRSLLESADVFVAYSLVTGAANSYDTVLLGLVKQ